MPVAGDAQKQEFAYVLSKQAYHSVSEGHLWFSIFSRPPANRFTCVQRCTCCFVLLLTSMLLNILYYDQAAEAKGSQSTGGLAVGPLFITPQQVCLIQPLTPEMKMMDGVTRSASVWSSSCSRFCRAFVSCSSSDASSRDVPIVSCHLCDRRSRR